MTAGNFSACKDNRNNSAFKNVWCTCNDLYRFFLTNIHLADDQFVGIRMLFDF